MTTETTEAPTIWLDELKAGDRVIINARYLLEEIATVERVTQTMITAGGMRFNRATGYKTGEGELRTRLTQATTEALNDAERRKSFRRVTAYMSSFNRTADDLTLEQWQRIQAIINEGAK